MEQKMFCYQCQETAGCIGCTMSGVCGNQSLDYPESGHHHHQCKF